MNASRFATLLVLLLCGALLAGCHPAAAQPPMSGHELYDSCKSCHKEGGQGDVTLAAPAIGGLPGWYVDAQLRKFRTGLRGAHPDDYEGLRMRPMSRQMANEQELATVTQYVAAMKPSKVAATLGGDAEAGKATYALCTACHGGTGLGNEALKAPPLAGQADWYLVSQMKKFKSGIRGSAAGDVMGAQMMPMAKTLPDEQSMKNVAAYISTFSR
jgi:cytochrome c553